MRNIDTDKIKTVMRYQDCPLTPAGDCCEVANMELIPLCPHCLIIKENMECNRLGLDGKEK